jgi:methionyl-tRNA formyltransferase
MINLHLGLSPYYRGSGTNFWPLVNREPECVGATIHLAVRRVDAGAIYAQVRPEVERGDRAHEIGTRAAMAGAAALAGVLARHGGGQLSARPQDLSLGRVYRRADFTADSVRRLWQNLDSGMVDEYLADAPRRQERYPIIAAAPLVTA